MARLKDRTKPLLATLAACALAVAAGCSAKEDEPDLVNGKTLFKERCQSCHDLARADAQGSTVGPNLDAAFANAKREGMGSTTIEGIVEDQIANPIGPQMPADLVSGDDRGDVAAYIAYAAARPGEDTGELAQAGQAEDREEPVAAENGVLELAADPSGGLAFVVPDAPEEGRVVAATAEAGQLELVMPNPSPIDHNIALKGEGFEPQLGDVVGNGGTSRVTVRVRPGEFTFFCSVSGHEQGGMAGTLTVE